MHFLSCVRSRRLIALTSLPRSSSLYETHRLGEDNKEDGTCEQDAPTSENSVHSHEVRSDREDNHSESEGEELDDDMARTTVSLVYSHKQAGMVILNLRACAWAYKHT